MSETKVNSAVVKKGVSGAPVIKLGVGKTNEMAPRSLAFNKGRVPGTLQTISFSFLHEGDNLGNYKHTGNNYDVANPFYSASNNTVKIANHGFRTGQFVFVSQDDEGNSIPGIAPAFTPYYIVKVDDNNISFATTKANAIATSPTVVNIISQASLPATSGLRVYRADDFLKLKNSLFDFNSNYPTYNIFNNYPADENNIKLDFNPDLDETSGEFFMDPIPYWRAYCSTLLPVDFSGFIGTRFYENEFPYKDTGTSPGSQFRVLGLYGASTSIPGSPININNPEYGILNPNRNTFNSGNQVEEWARVGAVASSYTAFDQNTTIPGNTNGVWTRNEWWQSLFTMSDANSVDIIKPGGKFKIGCKIRVNDDDMIRAKNFGGFYLSFRYHNTSDEQVKNVYYIAVKRASHTLNIPHADIGGTNAYTFTDKDKRYNFLSFRCRNRGQTNASAFVQSNYIKRLAEYNAEDLGSFVNIEHEISIPSDFSVANTLEPEVGFHLYFCESAEYLEGLSNTDLDIGAGTWTANMVVGKKYVINNPGTEDLTSGGSGLAKWRHLGVHTGTPAQGTIFRCSNIGTYQTSQGITGASVRLYDITDEVKSNQLVSGNSYFIRELGSQLTQSAMHSIAGTSERAIESSDVIRQGGTYTIVNHDENGTEQWSSVFMDNGDGTEVRLTESDEFARRALNGDGLDGMAFKCSKIEGTALNGNATIRTGGYPVNTSFTALNTTGIQQGYFYQNSGTIQFYSPYVEYIPPDQA